MPDIVGKTLVTEAPTVREDEPVSVALERLVGSGLGVIPVVDDEGRFKGIFGEREFITAIFPGYVEELSSAAFVTRELDEHLERRAECLAEPVSKYMNSEPVAVPQDFSYMQLAETFEHHRVRIIPVTDKGGRVTGVVTRSDFVGALAERFRGRR